ncbi:MAG: hypothetical protein KBG48_11420 [Kofleriaceae bacterium]|nr:hypothetical protein [Kofleriaceae bacterium]MBP9167994.1 hypothetical protein [Kofleriaceae bacterium]MBP9856828.1 hypothetical protein [Kofleriaceae bacterium]
MSQLAINQHGEPFAVPPEARTWLVRRMHDSPRGGPQRTPGLDGGPVTIPITADLSEFRAHLRGQGLPPGKYRLDPIDDQGQPVRGPSAYLVLPPERPERGELRNAGAAVAPAPAMMAAAAPFAHTIATARPIDPSTGPGYPLPVPSHLSGEQYLLGEAIRALAASNATLTASVATLMGSAADLLRAADGASMPKRRPAAVAEAPAPQVIVQPIPTPMYPSADDGDDDDDRELAVAPPEAKPAWQDKLGDLIGELWPMAQMFINAKLEDMASGAAGAGAAASVAPGPMAPPVVVAPPMAPAPVAPPPVAPRAARNARPPISNEPLTDEERARLPAAWAHLNAVARRIGPTWRAKFEAELGRMTPTARDRLALHASTMSLAAASAEAVRQLGVAETLRANQAAAALANLPEDAHDLGGEDVPLPFAPPDDDPGAPTAAELPTPAQVAATVAGATRNAAAGAAATNDAVPAAGSALADLYNNLVAEGSFLSPWLERIPGGAAGVEAMLQAIAPEAMPLINERLAAVAAPFDELARQAGVSLADPYTGPRPKGHRGVVYLGPGEVPTAAARATAPTAAAPTSAAPTVAAPAPTVAPAPAPVVPNMAAAMKRMSEVLPHLSPAEQATARTIAMRIPVAERNQLMTAIVAAPIDRAVSIVRDILRDYDATGRPFDAAA